MSIIERCMQCIGLVCLPLLLASYILAPFSIYFLDLAQNVTTSPNDYDQSPSNANETKKIMCLIVATIGLNGALFYALFWVLAGAGLSFALLFAVCAGRLTQVCDDCCCKCFVFLVAPMPFTAAVAEVYYTVFTVQSIIYDPGTQPNWYMYVAIVVWYLPLVAVLIASVIFCAAAESMELADCIRESTKSAYFLIVYALYFCMYFGTAYVLKIDGQFWAMDFMKYYGLSILGVLVLALLVLFMSVFCYRNCSMPRWDRSSALIESHHRETEQTSRELIRERQLLEQQNRYLQQEANVHASSERQLRAQLQQINTQNRVSDTLPSAPPTNGGANNPALSCSVCMDTYEECQSRQVDLFMTVTADRECGHVICAQCFDRLSDRKCPVCRVILRRIDCVALGRG